MVHKKKFDVRKFFLGESSAEYWKSQIADININDAHNKSGIITDLRQSNLPDGIKERYLKTAMSIKPDSFIWKKSWDKGKIFGNKKMN